MTSHKKQELFIVKFRHNATCIFLRKITEASNLLLLLILIGYFLII